MSSEEILKQNIMRRVLFIYGVKRLPAIFVPKFAVLASLIAISGFFVSLPNVVRNMPNLLETQKFLAFAVSAFLNTRFVIQVVAIGALLMLFFMTRDIVRTFRGTSQRLVNA